LTSINISELIRFLNATITLASNSAALLTGLAGLFANVIVPYIIMFSSDITELTISSGFWSLVAGICVVLLLDFNDFKTQ
jgi:predicted benzoate:H+ symporter BenE